MNKTNPQQGASASNEDHPIRFTWPPAMLDMENVFQDSQQPIPATAKCKHMMNLYKLDKCKNDFFS